MLTATAIVATSRGWGPFGDALSDSVTAPHRRALAQVTVFVQALLCLSLSQATQQRTRLLSRVQADERRYRHGNQQSVVGQLLLRPDDGVLVVTDLNDAGVALLGRSREQPPPGSTSTSPDAPAPRWPPPSPPR